MKITCINTMLLFIFSFLHSFFSPAYGQKNILDEAKEYISMNSGGTFAKPKALKNDDPKALPYIALKFRSASVGAKGQKKTFSKDAYNVTTYAQLEGIDSIVLQNITTEFYKIFSDKLKSAGVKLADMEKIKSGKKYKEFIAEPLERNYSHKGTGTSHIYSQNNDPVFEQPGGMKLYKFINETESGLIFLRLTVDFAEFDIDVKTVHHDVFDAGNTTTNASAKVLPTIKITSNWGETMGEAFAGGLGGLSVYNKKMEGTLIILSQPIYAPYAADIKVYDEKVPEFAQSHRLFGGGPMQLGTFVVKPTPEAFSKAAIAGLTKYADYVVAFIKSYNE
jgi:hypothetical protein